VLLEFPSVNDSLLLRTLAEPAFAYPEPIAISVIAQTVPPNNPEREPPQSGSARSLPIV